MVEKCQNRKRKVKIKQIKNKKEDKKQKSKQIHYYKNCIIYNNILRV